MEYEQKLIQNVLNDYEQGLSISEIKSRNNIVNAEIYKIAQLYGTPETTRKRNRMLTLKRNDKKQNIDIENVVKKLKEEVDLSEIAKEYGVHYHTLKSKLNEYEQNTGVLLEEVLPPNNAKHFRTQKIEISIEEIKKVWGEGGKLKDIADKYGVSESFVSEIKRKYERVNGKMQRNIVPVVKMYSVNRPKKEKSTKKASALKSQKSVRRVKKEKNAKVSISGIWNEYTKNGVPISELASRYGMEQNTLQIQLNKYRNYLLTEAYVKHDKSIAEIARESNLDMQDVKGRIKNVMREKMPTIPKELRSWYAIEMLRGKTELQLMREIIKRKQKETQKSKSIEQLQEGMEL